MILSYAPDIHRISVEYLHFIDIAQFKYSDIFVLLRAFENVRNLYCFIQCNLFLSEFEL